jgi:NAD(P)-dependent dehydrogenase (short-subunit alcohol dehydrogenase family)
MRNIAFITGADRGLGLALCEGLLQRNWWVVAGQYMPKWPELGALHSRYAEQLSLVPLDVSSEDSVHQAAQLTDGLVTHLDLLISNAGVTSPTTRATIREPQDYAEMHRLFEVNSLGALRMVKAFITLLDKGEMKRMCFVSSEAGSIGKASRESWFGYTMSKAALNMAVKTMFNHLAYFLGDLDPILGEPDADPEDRLVLRDWLRRDWPW